jgi:hypothetical protein
VQWNSLQLQKKQIDKSASYTGQGTWGHFTGRFPKEFRVVVSPSTSKETRWDISPRRLVYWKWMIFAYPMYLFGIPRRSFRKCMPTVFHRANFMDVLDVFGGLLG